MSSTSAWHHILTRHSRIWVGMYKPRYDNVTQRDIRDEPEILDLAEW